MRKLLIILAMLFCLSLSACGTSLNVNAEGDVDNQPSGFVGICDNPIPLCYDTMTRIVYIQKATYYGYRTYSPYYAPNGLPYRYNPEKNTFEEISI